jgi:hypothetical protein
MTLAIGLHHQDGILLCADTLMTTQTLSYFESKIAGYQFDGGDVVFAMAGNVELAEAAIQRCEEPLGDLLVKPQRQSKIVDTIREIWAHEYRLEFNYTPQDYQILCAIRSAVDGLGLYKSYLGSVKRCKRYECIGSGSDLANYLIKPAYAPRLSEDRVWNIAAYTLAIAKREMSGVIGGPPVILRVGSDSSITYSRRKDFELLERFCPLFDLESRALLDAFLLLDENDFEKQLRQFYQMVEDTRRKWKDEKAKIIYSAITHHAKDAITDFRSKVPPSPVVTIVDS